MTPVSIEFANGTQLGAQGISHTHRDPVTVTGGLPFWLVLDW
jgi:hypothetical protein